MLFAFLLVLLIALAVGFGILLLIRAGKLEPKEEKDNSELDENVPVEELHSIIKHQYVPYAHDETKVLAQVVCICGWSDEVDSTAYAKSRGEQHVNNERDRALRRREAARKVAEKLAENEKGDFAW